jgi:hypothetical protein
MVIAEKMITTISLLQSGLTSLSASGKYTDPRNVRAGRIKNGPEKSTSQEKS